MIDVQHLSKTYGSLRALDDVSFAVAKGEVVGFLGPNGAGKSTTLRILAGFVGCTAGQVRIGGHDVVEEPLAAKALVGYMPENAPLYPEMRVREYLSFRAELKGIRSAERRKAMQTVLDQVRIADVSQTVIGHLSKGYRQRVALADALITSPAVLILDEPTAGLDPNQIREVRLLIRELGKERTILLSTHILSEVESTCSRALVIHRGRLLASGTLAQIRKRHALASVKLEVRGAREQVEAAIRSVAPGATLEEFQAASDSTSTAFRMSILLAPDDEADGDAITEVTERAVAALVRAGIHVRAVVPISASLEHIFAELTEARTKDQPS